MKRITKQETLPALAVPEVLSVPELAYPARLGKRAVVQVLRKADVKKAALAVGGTALVLSAIGAAGKRQFYLLEQAQLAGLFKQLAQGCMQASYHIGLLAHARYLLTRRQRGITLTLLLGIIGYLQMQHTHHHFGKPVAHLRLQHIVCERRVEISGIHTDVLTVQKHHVTFYIMADKQHLIVFKKRQGSIFNIFFDLFI